jgi:hypothetical protein
MRAAGPGQADSCRLRRRRRYQGAMLASRRLPWVLVAVLLALLLCHEWYGADIWYHLYLGGRIVQAGSPQPADNLVLQQPGFVNLYCLFQLAARGAFALAGLGGVSLLCAAFWGIALAFWLRTTGAARLGPLGAAGALLAVLLCSTRFEERPEVLSFAFLAMQVHWLASLGPERAPARSEVLRFAVVEAAWANVHGYFVFGPVLVALRLLCLRLDGVRPGRGHWALLGATALATCATPFGPLGWAEAARFAVVLGRMRGVIQEALPLWRVPAQVWVSDLFWVAWFAVLALLWRAAAARRASLFALALSAGGLLLGIGAYRNIPLLVFLCAPLLGELARRPLPGWAAWPRLPAAVSAAAALLGAWVVSGGFYSSMGMPQRLGIRESPGAYPAAAARYLAGHGFSGTVFNAFQDGGYLEFHCPDIRFYADSRVTDVSAVRRYLSALRNPARFHELQEACAFDGALLPVAESRAVVAALLHESAWRIAQADLHRVLLVNRLGRAGSAAPIEEPAFYRGEDLSLPENGVPAVIWVALLAGARDRADLVLALGQFSAAPAIPSTLVDIAEAYARSRGDGEIAAWVLRLRPRTFPARPIGASALRDLVGSPGR